jgi:hypothetical protein
MYGYPFQVLLPIILPFELVHCHVWTSPVTSISGYRYYLVMLDAFTHYCWMFPLVHKFDVHTHITHFCNFVQTQFDLPIRNIRADNVKDI